MGLKNYFSKQPAGAYETLTFGELDIDDRYIGIPLPGDNAGHGGFKGIHYVFRKATNRARNNTVREIDNKRFHANNDMPVIKLK